MAKHSFRTGLTAAFIFAQLVATQESGWRNPDSSRPDFSNTYQNAEPIVISWDGLNQSLSDLWITTDDPSHQYSLRIAANIDITESGSLPWTVTVSDIEIDLDDRFRFIFIPAQTSYEKSQSDQFASPGFLLRQTGEVGPPSNSSSPSESAIGSTSVAFPSGTSTTTLDSAPAATETSNSDSGELSTGIKVGASIAALVTVVAVIVLTLCIVRLRRRVKAVSNHRSAGIVPLSSDDQKIPASETKDASQVVIGLKHLSGVHEARGDGQQPVELNASKHKSKVFYELSG